MSTREWWGGVIVLALAAGGCVADVVPAIPPGWLSLVRSPNATHGGYGGWLDLTVGSHSHWRQVSGEAIACGDDSTWVLTADGLVGVRNRDVTELVLTTGVDDRGRPIAQRAYRVYVATVREWCRFPQGLPAGVDRTRLLPKP